MQDSTVPALEQRPFDIHLQQGEGVAETWVWLWDKDLIFNFLTEEKQAVNGTTPWRGSYEKDILLYQQFVETLTAPGAIVLDVFASVGKQHYFSIDILILYKAGS